MNILEQDKLESEIRLNVPKEFFSSLGLRTTGTVLRKDCLHLCSPAKEEMSQDLSALSSSWCRKGQFINIEDLKKKKSKELSESISPKGQLAKMETLLEILLFYSCFFAKTCQAINQDPAHLSQLFRSAAIPCCHFGN